MFNGNRQSIDPETKQLSILYFDQGTLDLKELGTDPSASIIRHREARERPLRELLNAQFNPDISPGNVGKFLVEAHKRISSPLTALGFTLIGIAFLLTNGYSRHSQARPIVLSGLLIVSLLVSALGLQTVVARNLNLIFLIYLHTLLPIVIAGYFILRPEKIFQPKTFNEPTLR